MPGVISEELDYTQTKVNFHHLGICFKTPGYRRSVFIWKSAFYRARDRSKYATIIIGKVCTLKGGALNRLRNFYDIQQLCFSFPACHSIYSFLYHLTNNWRCYKSIVLYSSIIVDSKFLVIDIFNPSTAQGDFSISHADVARNDCINKKQFSQCQHLKIVLTVVLTFFLN